MSCNSHFDRLKIVRKGDCLARKICLYSLCPKYINADVNLLEIIEEKEKKEIIHVSYSYRETLKCCSRN